MHHIIHLIKNCDSGTCEKYRKLELQNVVYTKVVMVVVLVIVAVWRNINVQNISRQNTPRIHKNSTMLTTQIKLFFTMIYKKAIEAHLLLQIKGNNLNSECYCSKENGVNKPNETSMLTKFHQTEI